MVDALGDVVFQTDAEGNWTYLNPAWTRITGYSVEESLGTPFLQYVHPDERDHTIALFMAVVAGGAEQCHHTTRYSTRDGGYRWLELRARPLVDESGRLWGNSGTITDITERRLAEERLAEHGHILELGARGVQFEDLPVGVVVYSPALTVRRASPVVARVLGAAVSPGAPLEALLGLLAADSGTSDLRGEWGLIETARRTGKPQYGTVRLDRGPTGRRAAFHVSVLPVPEVTVPGPNDVPAAATSTPALALIFHDVSDLRRAEEQQAAVARLGQRGLSGAPVAELLDEAVGVVAYTLESTHCEVLELLPGGDGLLARGAAGWPDGARSIGLVPADPPLRLIAAPLASGAPAVVDDARADPALHAHPWIADAGVVSSLSVLVHGGDRGPFGVLGVQTTFPRAFGADEVDFLQAVANVLASAIGRRRSEEETRHQALHDPLTGLGNRVLLHDRLGQALKTRQRSGGSVALLLMDLDRFKEINDTLGHDVGDEVLRIVGNRLTETTRAADTVVRLGGDEFAVVTPTNAGYADALLVAAKVRGRVSEPLELGEVRLRVDASVGIVLAPDHGEDPVVLLKRADVAMYRAKNLATGVAVYSRESDQNRPERLAYFAALREAIVDDELVLHYQPKVDLRTGRTTAVEGLVRWNHPTEGMVPPDRFIPLAERTGLIKQLTWRVLSIALEQARAWRERGAPVVPIAVNISARMLHDADLVTRILDELRRRSLPPDALELELTESAVMSSPSSAMSMITRLRDVGVQISLDDFGIGYSSLAYLRDLPVDELKIDRSFVRQVAVDPGDASIVRAVIDLGHNLDLRVVGEGIETWEACELLRDLGCDHGQGFFFSKAVPGDELDAARVWRAPAG